MADGPIAQPSLRKAVCDHDVVGGNGLLANAHQTAFQQITILLVVWRDDAIAPLRISVQHSAFSRP
jgi:hypothetical protein